MFYRLLRVQTRDERSVIERYLYDHSQIIGSEDVHGRNVFYVLTTSEISELDVDYLANYQADRLSSGLHGAWILPNE